MSFDFKGPSMRPMIQEAQTMKNNGGGGNTGYFQQGRQQEDEEEKKEEESIFEKDSFSDDFTSSKKFENNEFGEEKNSFSLAINKIKSFFKKS